MEKAKSQKGSKIFIVFWMFAPAMAFLPTWWAAFTAVDISTLSSSQWWMFVVSNYFILKEVGYSKKSLVVLYFFWIFLTSTMQVAIWYRVGLQVPDIPWGIWWKWCRIVRAIRLLIF